MDVIADTQEILLTQSQLSSNVQPMSVAIIEHPRFMGTVTALSTSLSLSQVALFKNSKMYCEGLIIAVYI